MTLSKQFLIPFAVILVALTVVAWGIFFRPAPADSSLQSAVERAGWTVKDKQTNGFSAGVQMSELQPVAQFGLGRTDVSIEPFIVLYNISDRASLEARLRTEAGGQTQLGSRIGYLLPVPGLSSSSAFVVLGTTQAVSVSYALRGFGNFMEFTAADAPAELIRLIEALPAR